MEGESGEAGEKGRNIVSKSFTGHNSLSILKVPASTTTLDLFWLSSEEPHSEPLVGSTSPLSHNQV